MPLEIRVLGDTCSGAATGACCVSVRDCRLVDASTCAELGGAFRGESTACDAWCTCSELVSPVPPAIESIELLGGNSVRVHFDRPFAELIWSCLGMACAGPLDVAACWGHLPANVDDSGAAGASDVLAIVDALNGVTTLPSYRCDIGDSGACVPSDVLAVIDLLNGAGSFELYLNVDHPVACPTAR